MKDEISCCLDIVGDGSIVSLGEDSQFNQTENTDEQNLGVGMSSSIGVKGGVESTPFILNSIIHYSQLNFGKVFQPHFFEDWFKILLHLPLTLSVVFHRYVNTRLFLDKNDTLFVGSLYPLLTE